MKYINDNDKGDAGEDGRIAGCPLQVKCISGLQLLLQMLIYMF